MTDVYSMTGWSDRYASRRGAAEVRERSSAFPRPIWLYLKVLGKLRASEGKLTTTVGKALSSLP